MRISGENGYKLNYHVTRGPNERLMLIYISPVGVSGKKVNLQESSVWVEPFVPGRKRERPQLGDEEGRDFAFW